MPEDIKKNWHLYAVIGVLAWFVLSGKQDSDKEPAKPKVKTVQKIVDESMESYRSNIADAFGETAVNILEGKVKTGKQLWEDLSPKTTKSRESAFAGVDELIEKSLPRNDKDELGEEASSFIDSISQAFKKGK